MSHTLDHNKFPSITFEGEVLPQSLSGISILINHKMSEDTLDWIWRLPHCKNTWKSGNPQWCIESASEIIKYIAKNRSMVISDIEDRLAAEGFDGVTTHTEWNQALIQIQDLANSTNKVCRWIAGRLNEELSQHDEK